MQTTGNVLLGLATLISLVLVPLLLGEARRARPDGGALWGGIFVFLPLWLLLTAVLMIATARGGMDWLPLRRGGQYPIAVLTGIAMLTTSLFGFFGRLEPASQLPVVSRVFRGWADFVLPLGTILFLLITLNPGLGTLLPARAPLVLFAVLAGLSLLHGTGLLGEWALRSLERDLARARADAEHYSKFEREMLQRLLTLDPERDFAELLEGAAHPNQEIQNAALGKVRAHPDFHGGISKVLQSWRAEAAFGYLSTHPIPPEDRAALATPVLAGIGELARVTEGDIDRSTQFFADQYDRRTRLMLDVVDQFADQKVDYLPAVRELRRVLDTDRAAKVPLNARETLDAWLARRTKASRPGA